ncbi:MAG: hypothetical protein E7277_09410 [Lachnospiraceae bacterium]|jgi:hypothetical protein|nr:hypothetical protein [Lachnospiraceae bacterium]
MKAFETEYEAIMAFLDARTYEEKYNMLGMMHEFLSEHMINTLAASMDEVIPEGDLESRFEELRNCIVTHRRFEVGRR